jgi:hypothetical protein
MTAILRLPGPRPMLHRVVEMHMIAKSDSDGRSPTPVYGPDGKSPPLTRESSHVK